MAVARALDIIAFLIYIQGSRGQFNSLINNNPAVGQNSLNQGFQSTSNVKSITDNLFQNENLGKNTNFNTQKQVNSQQSSNIQSSLPITLQFPLQQSQNVPQLINQQSSPTSDLQQPLIYQSQTSFMSQSPIVQQQPYNCLESPAAFVPINNGGNIHYYQQEGTPSIQQAPTQVSQSKPLSNSYVSIYPSISPVPTCGNQRMEFVPNLGGNYLVPINTLPLPEGQIVTSYPTLPYTAILSTPNPTTYGNNVVMPYQNQAFGIFENPLNNFSETVQSDEVTSFESDKITKLLMSLLQTPKKSSKHLQSGYQGSSYAPYTPYKLNQDTKSSSLKALLPVILNLIKEKRQGCGCHSDCKCNRKNRNKKDSESQNNLSCSKKRDYSLKEEMFRTDESDEDTPRVTREHKKYKKIKNPVTDVSIESGENDDMDYDHFSEEEED